MVREVLRGVGVVLLVLGLAAPVAAQSNVTGSVQGTIRDSAGGPLPGVTVTASSEALVMGRMITVTDQHGVYRFPSLPIGSYAFEAVLSNFQTARQEDVRVRLGQALSLDMTLALSAAAEQIMVTAEAPLVSVVDNAVSTYFDTTYLGRQPLPRNYYNIIKSAPAVNEDYTASSGSAMLAYGGTGERQNAFTLDGVNVADAGAGDHWVLPSIQWMQEIQVAGLGADAEYGGFTGAVINGVTKSGGNQLHGGVEYYYEPASWVSDNDPAGRQQEVKFSDAAVSIGGPVLKDKLWFFVSGEAWHQVTTPLGAVDTSDRKVPRYLGKLTYQANDANRLMLMAEYDSVTNERRGISVETLPEATSKQHGPGATFALHWESLVNDSNFLTVKITGNDGRDDYLPYHGFDNPGRIDEDSGIAWVNQDISELNHRHIVTFDASWNLFQDGLFGGTDNHTFKFGVNYERASSSDLWLRNGGFTYYDLSSSCDSLDAYFADPTCGRDYIERGYGEYHEWGQHRSLAAFAQDSLRLERFTINVGARYGNARGGFQSGHGNSDVYSDDFVDPRVGLVWDLSGNGRTALKAHWGRYHGGMFTYLYDREASGTAAVPNMDCYWNSDTQQYSDCDDPAVIAARMGQTHQPYVDEALLTFEHQLGQDMALGLDLVDRRFRSFMAMVNANQDYTLLTATGNPLTGGDLSFWDLNSPQDWVLTTDNSAYRNYRSVILRFDKRYSHGWQLQSSLVWTDLKGNMTSNDGYAGEFTDINGLINADGKIDMAFSPWQFKLFGSVDLPYGFQASGDYTFSSGWYWTPWVRIRGLDYNSSTGRAINLLERGSNELPDRQLIDLRLAWSTKLGGALNLTASLECFNLLNKATMLDIYNQWGTYRISTGAWSERSDFGTPYQIEKPRELRAGIRLEF